MRASSDIIAICPHTSPSWVAAQDSQHHDGSSALRQWAARPHVAIIAFNASAKECDLSADAIHAKREKSRRERS